MHQIRIHLASIQHPVIGDRKYGDFALNKTIKRQFGLNYQLLHAYKLTFKHPSTNEIMTLEAPLPSYFKDILNELK